MKCPNCNAEISDTTNFCPECGNKIDNKNFCPKCGAKIQENVKFCQECGTKIDGKRTCKECGTELQEDEKFCPECGKETTKKLSHHVYNSKDKEFETPKEIKSLEQMQDFLVNLEDGADASIQEVLKSQLQVIQFIQSPELVDTTLDTLLVSFQKALKKSSSENEQEAIREQFSIMIQNYVFFFDARTQSIINNNRNSSRYLFCKAGEMLSQSIKNSAAMAISNPTAKAKILKMTVANLFTSEQETKGFFESLWNWWHSDEIIATETERFYKTIYDIFLKLGKYQSVIGKSMLISEMIERYKKTIIDYIFNTQIDRETYQTLQNKLDSLDNTFQEKIDQLEQFIESYAEKEQQFKEEIEKKMHNYDIETKMSEPRPARIMGYAVELFPYGAGFFGLSLVWAFFRWIYYGIKDFVTGNDTAWFGHQMWITLIIIAIPFGICLILGLRDFIRAKMIVSQREKDRDSVHESYKKKCIEKCEKLKAKIAITKENYDKNIKEIEEEREKTRENLQNNINILLAPILEIDRELTAISQNFSEL